MHINLFFFCIHHCLWCCVINGSLACDTFPQQNDECLISRSIGLAGPDIWIRDLITSLVTPEDGVRWMVLLHIVHSLKCLLTLLHPPPCMLNCCVRDEETLGQGKCYSTLYSKCVWVVPDASSSILVSCSDEMNRPFSRVSFATFGTTRSSHKAVMYLALVVFRFPYKCAILLMERSRLVAYHVPGIGYCFRNVFKFVTLVWLCQGEFI